MIGFLEILGGLALFLFGIRMLNTGMEKLTGSQIQKWLDRAVSGRIRSALFGTFGTAMIHSSGLLMVTMISLINANLMTVEQSISVMLGQEIGTTLTAQIVAFKIGNFNMIFVILGVLIFEFFRHRDWDKYGEILFGIGIVFLGMTIMSQGTGSVDGNPLGFERHAGDGKISTNRHPGRIAYDIPHPEQHGCHQHDSGNGHEQQHHH